MWPLLRVKSAAYVFAVSNWRSRLLAHSMLSAAQASNFLTTSFTSFPVAIYPRSSRKERPSVWTLSSTHFISPAVCIAKRIGDTGEPCGTPASTGWLCRRMSSITISTVLSERKLSVHHMRSLSIRLAFIAWISHPLATYGNAALISIRRTPMMLSSFQVECALSTMMAAVSMADHFFLLPN